jgi:secreted trypsin-like serine protease
MLSNNPGLGNGVGGTCSGDSGGPILVDGTNIVVAVNSFGVAPWCKGNDYAYRVDIQNSYDFLADYVSLP